MDPTAGNSVLAISISGENIYAGGSCSGDYTYRLKQIDKNGNYKYSPEIQVTLGSPKGYNISQNYPNPFNPSTKIKYSIPASEKVLIKVFDVLGREVTTLLNEYKESGTYEIEFNARNLSSGLYFYKLTSGNYSETKKTILQR